MGNTNIFYKGTLLVDDICGANCEDTDITSPPLVYRIRDEYRNKSN